MMLINSKLPNTYLTCILLLDTIEISHISFEQTTLAALF